LVVGFGCKARSGKDTLAQAVAARLPAARTFSLAADIKATARSLGMATKNPEALQLIGEAGRLINRNVWIERLQAQIVESSAPVALVPDVRYSNEARWITDNAGLLIRVDRVELDGTPFVAADRNPNHASETELEHKAVFDRYYTIASGDMASFEKAADQVVALIHARLVPPVPHAQHATDNPQRELFSTAVAEGLEAAWRAGGDPHASVMERLNRLVA
jgi:hypothetical protein